MKIYTKTGDKGETSLIGGERTDKDDPRIEAYGEVDELNAAIGLAISFLPAHSSTIYEDLTKVQHHLFDIGAELASLSERKVKALKIPKVTPTKVSFLEQQMDNYASELKSLTQFILPGGTEAASALHLARTICRRAERRIVSLAKQQPVNEELVRYLNRLSDLLFTAARLVNSQVGKPDIRWEKEG